ncbi:MAG: MoxR family ATPase, partial [Planctomycetota bacterium]
GFCVARTKNPIEQEGTYPLPEAQQDRFLFKVLIKYPKRKEEFDIIRQTTEETSESVGQVFTADEITEIQRIVRRVPVADPVVDYALRLVRQTRVDGTTEAEGETVPDFVKEYVAWGAGPRACQCLIMGAKAKALLSGRFHVSIDDVKTVALPVLRHRILTNFHAEGRGYTVDRIIDELVNVTPTESDAALNDGQVRKVLRP